MVIQAFQKLTDTPVKLFTFSDDMDGLRKVPDNISNKEVLEQNLNKPLTSVPDPFGKYNSFGEHNNERLKSFLDQFGFHYEFKSSTELYQSGIFDDTLKLVLDKYDSIMNIVLPTLGEERKNLTAHFFLYALKLEKYWK